jgi:hypothetical protein
MRAHFLVLLAGAALSACSAPPSSTSFVGPSGEQIHSTKCSSSPQGCFQEAAKTCGGPYRTLDSESHAGGTVADILPGPVTWYGLTYSCGKSDGSIPSFDFRGKAGAPEAQISSADAARCESLGYAKGTSLFLECLKVQVANRAPPPAPQAAFGDSLQQSAAQKPAPYMIPTPAVARQTTRQTNCLSNGANGFNCTSY